MTHYDEIKGHLERNPAARLRRKKNRFLAWLLERKFNTQMGIGVASLEDLLVAAASYDRAWRQVLQHEPQLRGADYGEKDEVEQEKELELGYQPGIKKDIKKVRQITLPYKDDLHGE